MADTYNRADALLQKFRNSILSPSQRAQVSTVDNSLSGNTSLTSTDLTWKDSSGNRQHAFRWARDTFDDETAVFI